MTRRFTSGLRLSQIFRNSPRWLLYLRYFNNIPSLLTIVCPKGWKSGAFTILTHSAWEYALKNGLARLFLVYMSRLFNSVEGITGSNTKYALCCRQSDSASKERISIPSLLGSSVLGQVGVVFSFSRSFIVEKTLPLGQY